MHRFSTARYVSRYENRSSSSPLSACLDHVVVSQSHRTSPPVGKGQATPHRCRHKRTVKQPTLRTYFVETHHSPQVSSFSRAKSARCKRTPRGCSSQKTTLTRFSFSLQCLQAGFFLKNAVCPVQGSSMYCAGFRGLDRMIALVEAHHRKVSAPCVRSSSIK